MGRVVERWGRPNATSVSEMEKVVSADVEVSHLNFDLVGASRRESKVRRFVGDEESEMETDRTGRARAGNRGRVSSFNSESDLSYGANFARRSKSG